MITECDFRWRVISHRPHRPAKGYRGRRPLSTGRACEPSTCRADRPQSKRPVPGWPGWVLGAVADFFYFLNKLINTKKRKRKKEGLVWCVSGADGGGRRNEGNPGGETAAAGHSSAPALADRYPPPHRRRGTRARLRSGPARSIAVTQDGTE